MRAIERSKPIATLHSPIARWPASSSARVTIPTGFVKSTIQASESSRTRAAISSTTGTVRSALANPPAPVVSCPMQPQVSGSVSSDSRADWPPTRIWISTKSAPSTARSSSVVWVRRPGKPCARASGARARPTTSSRAASMSCSASSSILGQTRDELRRVGRARADDRDLHAFTPVSVTPSTNALCAAKNSAITGAMKRIVAIIVRFQCTW